MPLPTIANVARVEWNWRNITSGIPATATNVLHCEASGRTEEEIANSFHDNLAAVATDYLFGLTSSMAMENITVTKLDGSSAGQVFPFDDIAGNQFGEYIPNGAYVITWYTGQRGARGRGRNYIGPIAEASQNNGGLVVGSADPGTAIQTFLDGLATDTNPLVVASYVHTDKHLVTSFTIHPFLRTQRRRARTR